MDAFGFPRGHLTRQKRVFGFQTGDHVRADVPKGKKAGAHAGRVAVRARGSFNIQTASGLVSDVSHRYCRLVQRADGYGYVWSIVNPGKDQLPGLLSHQAICHQIVGGADENRLAGVPTGDV